MKRKLTRHNGRYGKNGVYNSRHNDRRFDVKNSEHIDNNRTKDNIYWDRYGGLFYASDNVPERMSFEEVEQRFYEERYRDFTEKQNARNEARRHPEANRTPAELRLNKKTCPEESIYQMGTMGDAETPEALQAVATEFFERFRKLFGEHIHILHWALHLDEATPHIHEKHVFDCENKYGEIAPQQEKALELLGFNLPDPDKPKGRLNNRKMAFDATCRTLLFDIAKEHGLQFDEEPSYGGRAYLEKQDYIQMKQKEQIESQAERIDQGEEHLVELNAKIADVESLIDEVSEAAYDKAVEVVADTVQRETQKQDLQELSGAQKWLQSPERSGQKKERTYAVDFLEKVKNRIRTSAEKVRAKLRKLLRLPEKRAESLAPVKEAARHSILAILREKPSGTDAKNSNEMKQQRKPRGRDLER